MRTLRNTPLESRKRRSWNRAAVALLAGTLGVLTVSVPRVPALTRATQNRIQPAIVQVGPLYTYLDSETNTTRTSSFPWGSGAFISKTGLILTSRPNTNIASAMDFYKKKGITLIDGMLLVSVYRDGVAVPTFIASIVATGVGAGLLQIATTLDGQKVSGETVFPWVAVGDSDEVDPSDTLSVFGYGIGDDGAGTSLQVLKAAPGGSMDSVEGAKNVYRETDVRFPPGFDGGAVISDDGVLVGMPNPTFTEPDPSVPCKPTADSNSDGVIDSNDACPPPPFNYSTIVNSAIAKQVIAKYLESVGPAGTPAPAAPDGATPAPAGATPAPAEAPLPGAVEPAATEPVASTNAEDVSVIGEITDSTTGRPIRGAWFVILKPGQVWGSGSIAKEQILFALQTDSEGLARDPSVRLVRGTTYAVGAFADGFRPVSTSELKIPGTGAEPLTLQIALDRA